MVETSKAKQVIIFIGAVLTMLAITLSGQGINTIQAALLTKFNAMPYFAYCTLLGTIGLAIFTPIAGKLGDIFGKKMILLIGTVILLGASIIASFAPNLTIFFIGRTLIGVGCGSVAPLVYAILGGAFEPSKRSMLYGLLGAALAIGYFLGGTIGGMLSDQGLSWLAVLYPGIMAFIAAILISLCIKNDKRSTPPVMDWAGIILVSIGLSALLYASSFGNKLGWGNPIILGALAIFVVFIIAFIKVEQKAKEPLLPIYLFKNAKFTACLIITFLFVSYQIAMGAYAPLMVQKVLGQSQAVSGMMMLPRSVLNIIAPILAAIWISRNLAKRLWRSLFYGGALVTIAFVILSFTTPATSVTVFFVALSLTGIAEGFKQVAIMPYIQSQLSKEDMCAGSAVNGWFGSLSGTITGCILGIIYNSGVPSNVTPTVPMLNAAINNIFMYTAATGVLIMLIAFFVVRGNKKDEKTTISAK